MPARSWILGTAQVLYVKNSLESDYPGPETPAFRPIHGNATAISRKLQAAEPTASAQAQRAGVFRPHKTSF